LIYSSYWS